MIVLGYRRARSVPRVGRGSGPVWVAGLLVLLGRSPGGQRNGDGSQVGGDGYLQRDHDGAHGFAGGEGGRLRSG